MKIDEYTIQIVGDLSEMELNKVSDKLDEIREAIEEEAQVIFNSKLPARLLNKMKLEVKY